MAAAPSGMEAWLVASHVVQQCRQAERLVGRRSHRGAGERCRKQGASQRVRSAYRPLVRCLVRRLTHRAGGVQIFHKALSARPTLIAHVVAVAALHVAPRPIRPWHVIGTQDEGVVAIP